MARLQLQIFEGLSRGRDAQKPRVQEALARLNSELVDITTVSSTCHILYVNFGDEFAVHVQHAQTYQGFLFYVKCKLTN